MQQDPIVYVLHSTDWVVVLILLVMTVSIATRLSTIARILRKTNGLLEDTRRRNPERDAYR